MKKIIFLAFFCFELCFGSQISQSYTLSICTVKNLENSFTCIDRSLSKCSKVFIIGDHKQNVYRVNCGVFATYKEAKEFEKSFVSEDIRYNGPFIKSYDFDIAEYETFLEANNAIDISDIIHLSNYSKETYINNLTNFYSNK